MLYNSAGFMSLPPTLGELSVKKGDPMRVLFYGKFTGSFQGGGEEVRGGVSMASGGWSSLTCNQKAPNSPKETKSLDPSPPGTGQRQEEELTRSQKPTGDLCEPPRYGHKKCADHSGS